MSSKNADNRKLVKRAVAVKPLLSEYPRYSSTLTLTELDALKSLKNEWQKHADGALTYDGYNSTREILIVDLHDYEIYRSPDVGNEERRSELINLLHLDGTQSMTLCFNGYLVVGDARHYVQNLVIQDLSVEGYGDDQNSTVKIYIQSVLASKDKKHDIWYRLQRPMACYNRFHRPFLWVAQLTKYVVDYMESQQQVGLEDFRDKFCYWVLSRFSRNPEFQGWHNMFNEQTDFRTAVNEHINYIYSQAVNLPNWKQLSRHPLWGHCMTRGLTAIKKQPRIVPEQDTLATPHVYDCFSRMYFSKKLKEVNISKDVERVQEHRKRSLEFAENLTMRKRITAICQPYGTSAVKVGDVVAVESEELDRQRWKDSRGEWLAYVQATESLDNNTQRLFVLWLYRPEDTNIFKANYPVSNELFMSDNCNCDDGELLATAVKGKYSVDWRPKTLNTTKDFLVRQAYITQDSAYVTFDHDEHVHCSCRKEEAPVTKEYHKGDTVYITKAYKQRKFLEPVVIHHIHQKSQEVTVQRLLRLRRDCQGIPGSSRKANVGYNELVLSNELVRIPASRTQRKCYVRFLSKSDVLAERIPFPYDRGGAGDYWFLSMELITKNGRRSLKFLDELPNQFKQSPDFTSPQSFDKLPGMSLFSGGGNFDRGIEEGGAVDLKAVVEILPTAVHTVRANAKDPAQLKIFLGSVDDYIKLAASRENVTLVAQVGDIAFISAGSPCPGFSALQRDMLSEKSLGNASHISTFCSYVDLYRPLYGMLENVVRMASTHKVLKEDQNVLSQLVACLVSMGYQVNQYIMDSWSYGSIQRRSRIILTIAAPGLNPILQPPHTHSKCYKDTVGTSLGTLPNGERFGHREYYPTPFEHCSAAEILSDLPDIGNGNVRVCITHPDHRLSRSSNPRDRGILERIPVSPPGCGYAEAHRLGLIPRALELQKQETTRSYKRIKKTGLVPTITTGLNIQDARNGDLVHWTQHRPLSILEAKRTQGYLDNEPTIGSPSEQWKTIGNGVDRKVSFAMGLALRRAIESDQKQILPQHNLANATIEQLKDLVDEDDVENGDEETYSNSDSMLSCIDVQIPSEKKFEIQLQISTLAALKHTEHGCVSALSTNRGIGGVLDRSVTPEGAVGPSPLLSLSRPAPLSVRSKRSRQDNTAEIGASSTALYEHSELRKRSRHSTNSSGTSVSLPVLLDSINIDGMNLASTSGSRSQTSVSKETSKSGRRTRHSGAALEYEPKNWNARPEREFNYNR